LRREKTAKKEKLSMPFDAARCRATAPTAPKSANAISPEYLEFWSDQSESEAEPAAAGASAAVVVLDSFLLGAGALAEDSSALERLSAGSCLELRPKGWNRVEVLAPGGHPIGLLPPEDAQVVVDLMNGGAAPAARVRALVPAFRRLRVQLSIQVDAIAA
jgi:hypothetical protein